MLEIGGGTGANLPFYEGIETLTLTEPDKPMMHRLERRLHERSPGVLLLRAPAEDLPFEDDSFDVAISTLVLCTVDDQPRALRELRRVLKPGGRLLFIEHVRADDQRLARWQDRLNGLQTRIGRGCNCNRPTIETITRRRFQNHQARARRAAQSATDREAARRRHRVHRRSAGIAARIRPPVRLPIASLGPQHRLTPTRPATGLRNPLAGRTSRRPAWSPLVDTGLARAAACRLLAVLLRQRHEHPDVLLTSRCARKVGRVLRCGGGRPVGRRCRRRSVADAIAPLCMAELGGP